MRLVRTGGCIPAGRAERAVATGKFGEAFAAFQKLALTERRGVEPGVDTQRETRELEMRGQLRPRTDARREPQMRRIPGFDRVAIHPGI